MRGFLSANTHNKSVLRTIQLEGNPLIKKSTLTKIDTFLSASKSKLNPKASEYRPRSRSKKMNPEAPVFRPRSRSKQLNPEAPVFRPRSRSKKMNPKSLQSIPRSRSKKMNPKSFHRSKLG